MEATSGNTGIGLAMVCARKGYPLVVTMAESFSVERRKLLRFLGARVVLTPAAEKGTGMLNKAVELAEEHGVDQVMSWRRTYDCPPPALGADEPIQRRTHQREARRGLAGRVASRAGAGAFEGLLHDDGDARVGLVIEDLDPAAPGHERERERDETQPLDQGHQRLHFLLRLNPT